MTPGCPRDVRPKNFLFGLIFVLEYRASPYSALSAVLLGHTNHSVSLSHEPQHEVALGEALSKPIPDYQQGEVLAILKFLRSSSLFPR